MFNKLGWLKINRVVRPAGKHPREQKKGHMRGDIYTAFCEVSLQVVEVLIHKGDTELQQVKKAGSKGWVGAFK